MKKQSYAKNGLSYRLLVVDDEPLVLSSISRCLKNEGYRVDCISDSLAALEQARTIKYDLVLSDYKMPKLDGVMLLGLIRQIQPDAKRLILSAYTDKNALVEAINHASIERFIIKPWEPHNLRFEIRRSLGIEALGEDGNIAI